MNEKPFECTHCDRSFRTEQGRKTHFGRVHARDGPVKPRKKRGRRKNLRTDPVVLAAVDALNYCPCCGTNLHVVRMAMDTARQVTHG